LPNISIQNVRSDYKENTTGNLNSSSNNSNNDSLVNDEFNTNNQKEYTTELKGMSKANDSHLTTQRKRKPTL
jgi:hypothetical protein